MKKLQFLTFITLLLFESNFIVAQIGNESPKWSLNRCIKYALENNIDVKTTQYSVKTSEEELKQAHSSIFPNLTFSSSQSLVNQKVDDGSGNFNNKGSYSGSYSLNSGITIYNGGAITNNIKQKEIAHKSDQLSSRETQNNITISVTQAYLQIVYAYESVKINSETIKVSMAQLERAREFFKEGSISPVELAQFESQLSNDEYQLIVAQNTLAKAKLTLKQILELGINDNFEIEIPPIEENLVLAPIPDLNTACQIALSVMPQIEKSKLSIESSKLGEQIAKSGALPSISANASVGTGNANSSGYSFAEQLNNRLSQNIGLSISIPIYSKRSVRTSINKAQIETQISILNSQNSEKELLSTVETLHQNATSSSKRYISAKEKLKYYNKSYALISEQFNEGLKNTVELMTERKNYLSAQQEVLESKFESLLSLKLLKFYMNEPIEL